ncbi:MAG: hypothetical protein HOG18_09150 [Proteobacteria bacterium]|jgi:multidrug resistance efflux pump|nr:hypothetical protein [Pseudomonadota bacterium]MBT4356543.1 hypothetical protein [Pseudomonadota bacterium]MBT4988766.1 hypothetical protein [Pseudomonadota bacterium]MBT5190277.1 hypothetical protein [Pseudomonadota bacterium]MBT6065426.1 hypothetical protein [Pseudomonadota bacterium]
MSTDQQESTPKPRSIFRKEALEQLQSPEQLEQLLQVTNRRSWLTLGVFVVGFLGILLWMLFGRIPVAVSGEGVIIAPGQVVPIQATYSGYLEAVDLDPGDEVFAGQVVGFVRPTDLSANGADIEAHPILSMHDGVVLEQTIASQGFVTAGQAIGYLQKKSESSHLIVLSYFSERDGHKIRSGMPALVSPVTSAPEQDGSLIAQVAKVSAQPASFESVAALVGWPDLATRLLGETPRIQVVLELRSDGATPTGYQWTSGQGSARPIASGVSTKVKITTGHIRPISYIVPFLEDTH